MLQGVYVIYVNHTCVHQKTIDNIFLAIISLSVTITITIAIAITITITLLGTNISPTKALLKMIFPSQVGYVSSPEGTIATTIAITITMTLLH